MLLLVAISGCIVGPEAQLQRLCEIGSADCPDADSDTDADSDSDTDADSDTGTGPCRDEDNDGFGAHDCGGRDCDDLDYLINPHAEEIPGNTIDEDCSGMISCYLDNDGDRRGSTQTTERDIGIACDSTGTSTTHDDCDDSSATRVTTGVALNGVAVTNIAAAMQQSSSFTDTILVCGHWQESVTLQHGIRIVGRGDSVLTPSSNSILTTTSGITVQLEDLTLSGGLGTTAPTETYGGAIYSTDNSTVTLRNVTITDSTADHGAGIYKSDGVLIIEGSTIEYNSATLSGGGVDFSNGTLDIFDSTIQYNSIHNNTITLPSLEPHGGGIAVRDAHYFLVTYSFVTNNTAGALGPGESGAGGGIYVEGDSRHEFYMYNSTIDTNSAALGGGVAIDGAVLVDFDFDNAITHNTADHGGGLSIRNRTTGVNLGSGSVSSNSATRGGGGIDCDGGSLVSSGDLHINHNDVTGVGSVGPNSPRGGGIRASNCALSFDISDSNPEVEIMNNTAPIGGGVSLNQGTHTLRRVLIDGNTGTNGGGGIYADTASITLNQSQLQQNTSTHYPGSAIDLIGSTLTAYQTSFTNNHSQPALVLRQPPNGTVATAHILHGSSFTHNDAGSVLINAGNLTFVGSFWDSQPHNYPFSVHANSTDYFYSGYTDVTCSPLGCTTP